MYFPLMVQLEAKRAVVIGGGAVALRKCALLLDFGARVTAVAPAFDAGFDMLPDISCIRDCYMPRYLAQAEIVIAASDDREINRAVSVFCRENRIPVNVVDDPELCSFIVPAVLRRGDLTLAVSTGGKSPATAGRIKRELAEHYGVDWEERLTLLGEIREDILRSDLPPAEKRRRIVESTDLEIEALRAML